MHALQISHKIEFISNAFSLPSESVNNHAIRVQKVKVAE